MRKTILHLGLSALVILLMAGRPVFAESAGVDLANCAGWEIVVDAAAIPSELYAAEEFQHHFQLATSTLLPIVSSVNNTNGKVYIGASRAMQNSAVGFKVNGFGKEDFRLVVRDQNIAIAGGQPRGTLYGVYTFLEDYLGVRFLTHDHTHFPKIDPTHLVGPLDRTFKPKLSFRWSYYGENPAHPDFATRLRVNTITTDPKLGGKSGRNLIGHSFGRQIPSAKYGKDHPEYYCEIDGQRLSKVDNDSGVEGNEPCLSNPEVLKIVTDSVLADLRANPKLENISISQNDNTKYCRCAECAALDEQEGSPMGSLLKFVNAAASEVEKEFPHVKIGTLSYWYSQRPPQTIKPRSNVHIQLCSIECCIIHPIEDPDCPRNVRFCRDMKQWGEISEDIAIWNYNTNFFNYLLPCPNLRVIEPNVRYFVANKTKSIFMQAAGNTIGAELSDLRNYLISNLLWDSTRDGEALIDEFLTLHYAEAAPPIRRFINLVHDTAEQSGKHDHCFGSAADFGLGSESLAQAGLDSFDEAMQLASNDTIRQRVEKASVSVARLAIEPIWDLSQPSELDPELKQRMRPLVRKFFILCDRHGITRVTESETVVDTQQRLSELFELDPNEEF